MEFRVIKRNGNAVVPDGMFKLCGMENAKLISMVQLNGGILLMPESVSTFELITLIDALTGQRVNERDKFKCTHAFWHKQNAAIQLHHRDELCILHPAELEHSIRNDGVAVPLDDSKFHNIPPLHSAHLHFYRWG